MVTLCRRFQLSANQLVVTYYSLDRMKLNSLMDMIKIYPIHPGNSFDWRKQFGYHLNLDPAFTMYIVCGELFATYDRSYRLALIIDVTTRTRRQTCPPRVREKFHVPSRDDDNNNKTPSYLPGNESNRLPFAIKSSRDIDASSDCLRLETEPVPDDSLYC